MAERVRALDSRVAKRAEHLSAEVESIKTDMGRATRPKLKEAGPSRCLRPRKDVATETSETPSRKRKISESATVMQSKSPKVSSPSPRLVERSRYFIETHLLEFDVTELFARLWWPRGRDKLGS